MPTQLESKDLINAQQLEVAVNGPDGATYLILCTSLANLCSVSHEIFTFFIGPQLSQRQFVGAIASGALSAIQMRGDLFAGTIPETEPRARLIEITATYDEESGPVKVSAEITSSKTTINAAISYNVSILAELSRY